jgi:arylsulfatase A-like enzyme
MQRSAYRSTFLAVVAAAAISSLAAAAEQPAPAKALNVLVILSDDQRFDTIGGLGNPDIQTPHLDRLAQSGFVFRRNFVMGSMGGAVCVPSRAMLHSGCTLWRADTQLRSGPLLAETLARAGYATFGTGKWHNGPASFARGFSRGKAVFFGGMNDHDAVPVQDLESGKYGPRYIGKKFSSELFADAAVDFLRGYKDQRPFFLYVAFTAPHDPRMPPGEYAAMYDPAKLPLPKNFLPRHPFDNGELWGRDEMLAPHPRTPAVVRRHLADYYGMISHMDAQIGRILKTLDDTGRRQNTLIVFAGDNGLALGQHGLFGKQNLYEHSTRMPLMIAGPGIAKGRSDALVYLLDVFPTICDLAAVAIPDGVDGKSLVPILRDPQAKLRDHLLLAYRDLIRAIREPRWKLIKHHVAGVKTTQLFDLDSDPLETNNLAGDASCAAHLARLSDLLDKARREAGDPIDFDAKGGKSSGPEPVEAAKPKAKPGGKAKAS